MPVSTPEEKTKKIIVQRLRRHDKQTARRVRLLPAEIFASVTGHEKITNGNSFEEERLSLLLQAKDVNEKYTGISRLISGACPPSLSGLANELRSKLQHSQIIAHALIQHEPEHDDSATQFLSMVNTDNISPDTIPTLARKIGALSQKSTLNGMQTQAYIKKALLCLSETQNAIYDFWTKLKESPDFRLFNQPGFALASIPEDWASTFNEKTLREALGIDLNVALIFVGNNFSGGATPVLYSTINEKHNINANGLEIELTPSALKLVGHEGFDELLSAPVDENLKHPLTAISKTLSEVSDFKPVPSLNIKLSDLGLLNKLQIECRVSHIEERNRQIPAFLTLDKLTSAVFEGSENKRYTDTLSNAQGDVTLVVDDTNNIKLHLNQNQIALINGAETNVTFEVTQSKPGQFFLGRSLNQKQQNTLNAKEHFIPIPDPGAIKRHATIKDAITPLKDKGYISESYSPATLKRAFATILGSRDDGLTMAIDALSATLKASNATTLISVQFDKEPKADNAPYQATMTLFSLTEKGPNVRSVNSLIRGNISTPTLEKMGLSPTEFSQHAVTLKQAEDLFNKTLNNAMKNGRIVSMVRNAKPTLASMSTFMPELVSALSDNPIIDPLTLTKQHQLGRRTDAIFPLYIERNGGKPVYFSDTPGSEVGVRGLLSRKTTRTLSDDTKFALVVDGDEVALHDLENNRAFEWGDLSTLSKRVHSSQQRCNAQHTDGDELRLLSEYRISELLKKEPPQNMLNKTAFIDSPAIRENMSPVARVTFDSIAIQWDELQSNFDFSKSIQDNIESLGLEHDAVLSGGVGSQKGKRYLQRLYRQSQPYFFAVTSGKKIDIPLLLTNDNPAIKITANDASLTLFDVLSANFIALQAKNPARVNHYQKQKHAHQILSLIEPNTTQVPKELVGLLSREFGYTEDYINEIYLSAYKDKEDSTGMFQSFLPDASRLEFGSEGRTVYPIALISKLKEKLGDSFDDTLKLHIQSQMCKIGTISLAQPLELGTANLNTPMLTKNQLTCRLKGDVADTDRDAIANQIEHAIALMHLGNGVSEVKKIVDANVTSDAENLLVSHLHGQGNIQVLTTLNHTLSTLKAEASIAPNDAAMQLYAENILLASLGLRKSPEFNRSFSFEDLNLISLKVKDVIEQIDLSGLIPQSAKPKEQLDRLIARAVSQYHAASSIRAQVRGGKRTFLSDDPITNKNGLIELSARFGGSHNTISVQDALLQFIDENKGHLPANVKSELGIAVASGEVPAQGSDAKPYYQELLRQYRLPPSVYTYEGPAFNFIADFSVRNTSPIDSMLDTPIYQSKLNLSQEPQTPPDMSRDLSIKRGK